VGRLRLVDRASLARYGAPLAFLAAVTAAVLLVRAGLDGSSNQSPGPPPVVTTTGEVPSGRQFYRVRPGDSFATIAARLGTTPERLQALNPGVEPTSLRVGQRIRVR
jgi:spore germination protein YaaH